MKEINIYEIQHLIPSINENIFFKRPITSIDFYEVCKSEKMLIKVNEDIKKLLLLIDGKMNISDIVNIFNPPLNERENITKLVYETLLKLEEEKIVRLVEESTISFSIKETEISFLLPKVVTLELTNKCNLACRYCFQNSSPSEKGFLKNPFSLLSFLKDLGTECIELSGGEPTLHPDFSKIINYIVNNFETYSLITNGTLLNDEILGILSSGKGAIQICIDSSSEDGLIKIAGTAGILSRLIDGVKKCVSYRIPVRVGMVLDDAENINDIENVLILAKELGAHSFVVNPAMNIGRGRNLNSFTDDQIKEFTLKHNELILRYPDFYGLETVSWDTLEKSINCGAGSTKVTVSWDGRIKLCSLQEVGWLKFGNIYDIKNDELQKKIKTVFSIPTPTKEICSGCINTYYCMKCTVRPLNLIKTRVIDEKECKWFFKYQNELKILGY